MGNSDNTDDEFQYLAERAALFFTYLDSNEILTIFPSRKATWKDLDERVQSGSKRKLKILNELIDNTLVGRNSLGTEDRFEILRLFDEKLGEGPNALIDKMIALYDKIIRKGIIDSNIVLNQAIEIRNSEILELTPAQKSMLTEIITLSMEQRK
jgi:hypothetical protein